MKISDAYVMREIAGECVVVPTGPAAIRFNGMITLNELASFLWKQLQAGATEESLLAAVLEEYEVDEDTARTDLREYLDTLRANQILEDE